MIKNPAAPAIAHLASIAYPIYWSAYKIAPFSLGSMQSSTTESEAGPIMVYWILFALFNQIVAIYPGWLFYFIEPALHFCLWCPVIGGAKSLHSRFFDPICQILFHNHFDPIAWKKIYPLVARILRLYNRYTQTVRFVQERLNPEETKQLNAILLDLSTTGTSHEPESTPKGNKEN
ncbi:unnamed protein product [Anisakis simplex]|uniref:Receptor expression-enhancing protein n=1 Tax=Anisakis simplex TaxID=6269 RepID=A0A3P6NW92_ANISI|nr:unnamed protein product [Anisakis simplex]